MTAWLQVQNLLINGTYSAADITAEVKSVLFADVCSTSHGQSPHFKSASPDVSNPNEVNSSAYGSISAKKVGDEFFAYMERKFEDGYWTEKTRLESKSIFDTFVEVVGNKPVTLITKADVEAYANVVNYLPPNRKKMPEFRHLSAVDASHKNKVAGGARLSPVQRKKYFTRISPIFNEFVEDGLLSFNYFHRYRGKIRGVQQNINARNPFSTNDLHIMFESDKAIDLLTTQLSRPSRAWGYLIALFTGARAEEIFSLSIENIRIDDGTKYFNIDGSVGSVKTEASIRKIPVHPTLLELGFLSYLEHATRVQKHRDTPMLFPELRGYLNHGYRRAPTQWFNTRFLPELGLKTEKKSFHGFRHTVADKMKRARRHIDSGKASQYIGHEDRRGPLWEHLYGSPFTPSELLSITKVIDYSLNFSRLKERCLDRMTPRWHP